MSEHNRWDALWHAEGAAVVSEDGDLVATAVDEPTAAAIARMPQLMATLSILVDWASHGGLRSWQMAGDAVNTWTSARDRLVEMGYLVDGLDYDLPQAPESRQEMARAQALGVLHLATRMSMTLKLSAVSHDDPKKRAWLRMVRDANTLGGLG